MNETQCRPSHTNPKRQRGARGSPHALPPSHTNPTRQRGSDESHERPRNSAESAVAPDWAARLPRVHAGAVSSLAIESFIPSLALCAMPRRQRRISCAA